MKQQQQARVSYAKLQDGTWGLRGPLTVIEPAVVKEGQPAKEEDGWEKSAIVEEVE